MPLTGGAAADAGRLPGRDTSPGEPGRAGTAGPAGSTDDAGADLGRQGSVLTVPGRAEPLRLGSLTTPAPVALSPMAGVTNAPYRALCRWFGPGLFVAEMVSAQALVQRNPKAYRLLEQWPGERPRSVQLFGTDPAVVGQAAELIGREDLADHIDLNFGCPMPKVTRHGGGSALPWKLGLFREIVARAVEAAGRYGIPVTVKMRTGIDPDHLTYLEAGRAAAGAGAAAITLHARTASQYYSGRADWSAIGLLKREVTGVPVLGNGDVFSGEDAVLMLRETGCDGVVIGRGAQGRPWLFRDVAAALRGSGERFRPTLGEVCGIVRRHAELLVRWLSESDRDRPGGAAIRPRLDHPERRQPARVEAHALAQMRSHLPFYLRGFPVGGEVRARLGHVASLAELDRLLEELDADAPYPERAEGPRGRAGSPHRVALPEGWLETRD